MSREEIAYVRGVIDSCEIVFAYAGRFKKFLDLALKLLALSKIMLREIEQVESWRDMSAAGFTEATIQEFEAMKDEAT